MANYKLSCVLSGHSLDVRGVTAASDGVIISGSRDATAKVWRPNGINPGFHEAQTLRGHTNFVSCVCYCLPCDQYANGIILTGGNDKNICGFVPEQEGPLFTLKGHTETVCCLSLGDEPGTFLSSSWDHTSRVWNLMTRSSDLTLKGHEMAVWCVIQVSSLIISGSADKTIKIWVKSGKCQATLTGHSDVVRSLAKINGHEFLSCANDAAVRHWSTTGDCLGVLYGHSNYIYSLAVFPDGSGFVSAGEDSSLRVWSGSEVAQTLTLPAQSVWSVAVLPNSDIVTGSSDGMVRVFSRDPNRQADEDTQKCYEEEIAAMFKVSSQQLGGVKISDLPGKESLYEPGRSDGQTKLVRDGAQVMCYSWSAAQKEWTKIGDVTGANEENSGKSLHNGKEYDYVFSIDIQDGVPALKLPYNVSEDPWFVAQKFIHENDLPQAYLEQIANHIVNNSKRSEHVPGPAPSASGQVEFCDPFTGANRYIPTGSEARPAPAPAPVAPSQGYDPFTGANRYVPNGGVSSASVTPAALLTKLHFPQKSYLRFDQANLKAMLDKLQELNGKTGDGPHHIDEGSVEGVVKLCDPQGTPELSNLPVLRKMLEWPLDMVFPVLDVTRLAVRHADVNCSLCEGNSGEELMAKLRTFLQPAPGPNQMLTLRILCNLLTHRPGEGLVEINLSYLVQHLEQSQPPFSKPLEVALATLLLNLSVLLFNKKELQSQIDATGSACSQLLPRFSDKEALYRGLVACGTLLSVHTQQLPVWAQNLWPHVISMGDSEDERIKTCAQQLLAFAS